ncbi:hypothetical protein [Polynucleobacter sp. IMCC 29146]|uniref:hypothetical protein n=1 Tax=Polynucleobacter sp. IMCC 29146 TaxID=2780953 RepID=UPI001F3D8A87|nr:hypothetical protein [Polynucleobacter sp. IMCC 29146]MCE7530177.1 hypothetical protein [Polynucleobacter sp. IMCC 29146]
MPLQNNNFQNFVAKYWPNERLNALVLFGSILISLFLFFHNPFLPNFFRPGSEDWYINFSVMIFHPNESYWNESILLPLLAKLLGGARSLESYKILCSFITILIIPLVTWCALVKFKSIPKTLVFLLIFAVSFQYFSKYDLGYPDPLTILFLVTAPFQNRRYLLFSCIFMAALSHFSITLIAAFQFLALLATYYGINKVAIQKYIIPLMGGLFAARVFLEIWYFIFKYTSPYGRIEFIINHGLQFFEERYFANPSNFWLIPGLNFLLSYSLFIVYFSIRKKFLFVLALFFNLGLTYAILFFTVDGFRIFATINACSYVFLIMIFVTNLSQKYFPEK